MKILYLCKRHYMGHDVIKDRYARLYEQPFQLAQHGNELLCICLSYRPCSEKDLFSHPDKGSIHYLGFSPGRLRLSILRYPFLTLKHAIDFKPDLIVASSDCLHIILGQWLAAKLSTKFAVDLYDDYESFQLSKIPFIKQLYRRALKKAHAISCVSKSLADHIRAQVDASTTVCTLPSTINKSVFFPRNKMDMRKKFNLPSDKKIIGTAGGLTKEKGIETVYKAFLAALHDDQDLYVALAGVSDSTCPPPVHDRVRYLGKLPHHDVADFFGALDVGVVYLRDTMYGKLSFPQKAYEMAACKIPMVVTNIGDMSYLFSKEKNESYSADNIEELKNALINQLNTPQVPDVTIEDWHEHGKKLNRLYQNLINS